MSRNVVYTVGGILLLGASSINCQSTAALRDYEHVEPFGYTELSAGSARENKGSWSSDRESLTIHTENANKSKNKFFLRADRIDDDYDESDVKYKGGIKNVGTPTEVNDLEQSAILEVGGDLFSVHGACTSRRKEYEQESGDIVQKPEAYSAGFKTRIGRSDIEATYVNGKGDHTGEGADAKAESRGGIVKYGFRPEEGALERIGVFVGHRKTDTGVEGLEENESDETKFGLDLNFKGKGAFKGIRAMLFYNEGETVREGDEIGGNIYSVQELPSGLFVAERLGYINGFEGDLMFGKAFGKDKEMDKKAKAARVGLMRYFYGVSDPFRGWDLTEAQEDRMNEYNLKRAHLESGAVIGGVGFDTNLQTVRSFLRDEDGKLVRDSKTKEPFFDDQTNEIRGIRYNAGYIGDSWGILVGGDKVLTTDNMQMTELSDGSIVDLSRINGKYHASFFIGTGENSLIELKYEKVDFDKDSGMNDRDIFTFTWGLRF